MTGLFVKIGIMVALGFFLKRKKIITQQFQSALSDFLLNAVLPFSVLASAGNKLADGMAARLGQSALIACGYYCAALVVCVLLGKVLWKNGSADFSKKRGIFSTMSVFANTGFIGLPLVEELFGSEGMLYGVIYNMAYQLFLFTIGIALLSGEHKISWKALFSDVTSVVSILAIVLYLSPFRFPAVVNDAFTAIGDMCVPLSMIVIGCCIADVHFSQLVHEKYGYLISALRLLIFPLLLLFLLRTLNITSVLRNSCVVLTALPVGSLNVLLAERYKADVSFSTCAVVQSLILFMGTLPVILYCLGRF